MGCSKLLRLFGVLPLWLLAAGWVTAAAPDAIDFNRDIRPILA